MEEKDDEAEKDTMEEDEASDKEDETPTIPQNASILQCVKGLINIFETAAEVEFPIIDRESMLLLFEEQRERRLLCDANILKVLHAMYELCEQDEAILRKLHTWTVYGTKKKRNDGNENKETIESVDAIEIE